MSTSIITVPLSELHATRLNVRKTGQMSIEDLAASIKAHSLMQNLVVTKDEPMGAGGHGGYLVVAGSRRLKALQTLEKAGELPSDLASGIPCKLVTRDAATESSLAENLIREGMHPADEFDAFKRLADAGISTAEICARFGQTELYVKQRLKLANVAPKLLDLYRVGKADLEQMMTLALVDDQLKQLQVWNAAKHEWQRQPDNLRDALVQTEVKSDSKLARFVGVSAYEKAGGAVRRDLFSEEGDFTLIDAEMVQRLAAEKLERTAAKMRNEGWKWVETRIESDYSYESQFKQLDCQYKGSKQIWTDEQKARAGVLIKVGYNGQTEIERGLARPGDAKSASSSDTVGRTKKAGDLPFTAVQRLQADAQVVMQVDLAKEPRAVLRLLAADLAMPVFYKRATRQQIIHLDASRNVLPRNVRVAIEASEAGAALAKVESEWRAKLPKKPEELRDWLAKQPFDDVLALLSYLAAREFRVVDLFKGWHSRVVEAARVTAYNLGAAWKPTEAWLATLPKSIVIDMVRDAAGKTAAAPLEKLKKDHLPKAAVKLFPAGWLPKPLRPKVAEATKKPPAKKAPAKRAKAVAKA
jgi:ParB family chromosome partitioning protein